VEQTLARGQEAYMQGDYNAAFRLARHVIDGNLPRTDADFTRAWRILGTSGCFLHDRVAAVTAWKNTNEESRRLITYVCERNEIQVP
jgi:hypothetical protein